MVILIAFVRSVIQFYRRITFFKRKASEPFLEREFLEFKPFIPFRNRDPFTDRVFDLIFFDPCIVL